MVISARNKALVRSLCGTPHLFESERRRGGKTNLMMFLRPVVLRDAAQIDALPLGRYACPCWCVADHDLTRG